MAKITIDLSGTGPRGSRPETRLLRFPDGLHRSITLPRRKWRFFDILREQWVYEGMYEQRSYDLAIEDRDAGSTDFDRDLLAAFELSIQAGWDVYLGYGEQAANR
tara:strand:- start:3212 stop:3526 length:315 start_codon:yes stop_codon:yes gene_type:complete